MITIPIFNESYNNTLITAVILKGVFSQERIILTGSGKSKSRFGLSLSTAGDINNDGFDGKLSYVTYIICVKRCFTVDIMDVIYKYHGIFA